MYARQTGLVKPGSIDSRIKLTIILFFCRHRALCESLVRLIDWLKESPWVLEEALDTLADSGLLLRRESPGGRRYVLNTNPAQLHLLEQLTEHYNDPLRRDELYQRVRSVEEQQRYQAQLRSYSIDVLHADL
jgi:hypothetical protein